MVDAADHEKLDASKNELHSLLDKPQLSGIPVSIKCDMQPLLILIHMRIHYVKSHLTGIHDAYNIIDAQSKNTMYTRLTGSYEAGY